MLATVNLVEDYMKSSFVNQPLTEATAGPTSMWICDQSEGFAWSTLYLENIDRTKI